MGFTNWGTHHGIAQMWVWQATHKTPASHIPLAKLEVIHQGALEACDAKDGVKDDVITDPPRCKFDPAVLQCKGADAPNCLTAPQIEAVRDHLQGSRPREDGRLSLRLDASGQRTGLGRDDRRAAVSVRARILP